MAENIQRSTLRARCTRYTFLQKPGATVGELHFENRVGYVKFVALAQLTPDGWLVIGNGSWLRPGTFRVQTMVPAASPELVKVIVEAMAHARRLLNEGRSAPVERAG